MIKLFVFDTNVLISAILFGNSVPAKAYHHAEQNGVIVSSTSAVDEFETRILKSKFDKYLSLDARLLSVERYRSICKLINPQLSIKACRDPQDDKFLEIAVAVNASCIVTGDRDLLTLHPFCNTPILSPADFLMLF